MQTNFTLAQLADPDVAESEKILRKCVHCGFCTATCPTYVLLGDELDVPRGRIYLIKDMLENAGRPTGGRTHIDRCLSCLACMTTCPSGVNYMHLVDHARAHIEETYGAAARPPHPRAAGLRAALSRALPRGAASRPMLGTAVRRAAARRISGLKRARRDARSSRRAGCRRARRRPARRFPADGRAARPRRAPHRLRPTGARSRHQRRRRSGC